MRVSNLQTGTFSGELGSRAVRIVTERTGWSYVRRRRCGCSGPRQLDAST